MYNKQKIMISGIPQEYFLSPSGSSSLLVLFPGMGYTCDKPLLHYAKACGMASGYDVLCIRYGSMTFRKEKIQASIQPAYEIALQTIKHFSLQEYTHIRFISKSLGTIVAGRIAESYTSYDIQHMFLTPLKETIPYMKSSTDITISGDEDPMISRETLMDIAQLPIQSYVLSKANHSLEVIEHPKISVEYLQQVVTLYQGFL